MYYPKWVTTLFLQLWKGKPVTALYRNAKHLHDVTPGDGMQEKRKCGVSHFSKLPVLFLKALDYGFIQGASLNWVSGLASACWEIINAEARLS